MLFIKLDYINYDKFEIIRLFTRSLLTHITINPASTYLKTFEKLCLGT